MDIVGFYLKNLAKRALTDGPVHPVEIAKAPQLIDKVYGDGDGVFEISDMLDCGATLVSETVEKAGKVIDFLTDIF